MLLVMLIQVSRFCKAFANNFSANIKLSKIQLHKIGQSGRFIGRLLGPLLKTGLFLMKIVFKLLIPFMPLGLTAAAAAAAIHKRNIWIRYNNINNFDEKTSDAMKIVKYFKESGLLKKAKQLKMKQKNKK